MEVKKIVVLGTNEYAEELADLISDVPGLNFSGFVETGTTERPRQTLRGYPVIPLARLEEFADTHQAVLGAFPLDVGPRRRIVENALSMGMAFVSVLHPTSWVSSTSSVGAGTVLGVYSIVAAYAKLGKHVRLNRGASLGHHVELEDHVAVGPGAAIASSCKVGEGTYVGVGAVIRHELSIGRNVVVGAGAVVVRDIPDNVQVVGVPARIVKENPMQDV